MTIGIVVVASLAAKLAGEPEATITSTFSATSSAASTGEPIVAVLREPVRDDDILALDVAELAQSLEQASMKSARPSREPTATKPIRGAFAGFSQPDTKLDMTRARASCRSRRRL
jgi:hypothetical protein